MDLRFKHKNETIKYSKLSVCSHFPHVLHSQSWGMLHPVTGVTFTESSYSPFMLIGESILLPIPNFCQPQAGTYTFTETSGRVFCLFIQLSLALSCKRRSDGSYRPDSESLIYWFSFSSALWQCFSNFNAHSSQLGALVHMQTPLQKVFAGAWDSAFLLNSQCNQSVDHTLSNKGLWSMRRLQSFMLGMLSITPALLTYRAQYMGLRTSVRKSILLQIQAKYSNQIYQIKAYMLISIWHLSIPKLV